MAKPATEARLAAAAKGFTQVIGRGNAHIITRNPSNGKCAYDGQVGGGWHYGAGLETDTAFEPDTDTNYWKMVKALYNVRARKSFSAGDLLKWTDPTTGQYVILQPNNLSWVDNVTESQQFISSPAAVTGQATDDVILWNAAYGVGRHFRYQAGPLRLTKHFIIDAPANLPAATVSNPYLEIAFVMTPSSGVSLIADGTTWDKKTKKNTANAIEFRTNPPAPAQPVTLWSFAAPKAFDSAGNEVAGILQLRKQGANFIAAVRFPKSFFDAAAVGDGQGHSYYPVMLDPTVDYQVGLDADDAGFWYSWGSGYFQNHNNYIKMGVVTTTYEYYHGMFRFTGVTIPVGATIDNACISVYYYASSGTPQPCTLSFNDAANPSAPTNYTGANGLTLTTANISFTPPTGGTWNNSDDASSIIQELNDSYDYSGGAAMICVVRANPSASAGWSQVNDLTVGSRPAKLHIEYTEAAAGKPAANVIWIG